MKHLCALLFAWILMLPSARANHIAGGDFSVRHIMGNTFQAKLILYRDCQGNLVLDQLINISVFEVNSNLLRPDLAFTMTNPVAGILQLGNSCYDPNLCIESQTYIQNITLPNLPGGYYMTWERCCRNTLGINLAGNNNGMVFTVQIADPALQSSTPEFVPYPTEAFLCLNAPNTISFTATDIDGDELVYSFTDALGGSNSAINNPAPAVAGPRPYQIVNWAVPFSVNDQVGGDTPMTIDPATGLVQGQPNIQGYYSIAVKVEEFRNGVKIGEVRREIQVAGLVCNIDLPAEISTSTGDSIYSLIATMPFCLEMTAIDPNSGDTLFFQASGPLFDGTAQPQASFPEAEGFGAVKQDFCWIPACENVRDEPYIVTFTAFSLGCAADVNVTTRDVYLYVVLEPNLPTTLEGPQPEATIDLYDPSSWCFNFEFFDPNVADSLFITATSEIFDRPNAGTIDFEFGQNSVNLPYCWQVVCADVRDEPYFVDFEVITTNCLVRDTNYFSVPVRVIVPDNLPTAFVSPPQQVFFEFYTDGDSLCFNTIVTDGNFFDTLTVRAVGLPFELTPNAATFSPDTGLVQLNTLFCWAPSCEDVRPEPYLVTFIATSQSCKTNDVVEYPVEIFLTLPPESPLFIEMPSPGVVIEHFVGDDLITILAVARDVNPYDTLTITAASPAFTSPGTPALFAPFTNTGIVASEFTWQPSCPDVSNDLYPLTFTVTSRSCQKDVSESVTIQILVTTPTRGEIAPIPNVFTPNRDGRNDFWNIEDKGDPCLLNFRATVWDRWGREIYTTNNPAFEWSGENSTGNMATDGTYFHVIEYIYSDEKRSYSGNVQILRENNR